MSEGTTPPQCVRIEQEDPEVGPAPPEPCQYCSVMAGELKEHDGSCDSLTKERWIELTGDAE